jgi:hypothetical protein
MHLVPGCGRHARSGYLPASAEREHDVRLVRTHKSAKTRVRVRTGAGALAKDRDLLDQRLAALGDGQARLQLGLLATSAFRRASCYKYFIQFIQFIFIY